MKPVINVEFTARTGERIFKKKSIGFKTPTELFNYVRPGGDCERIADDVEQIQMVFRSPATPNSENPMSDVPVTLKMGMVLFTGPLSDIVQTTQQLLGKASRGEISTAFLRILRVKN